MGLQATSTESIPGTPMPSTATKTTKAELQNRLKDRYKINKNISEDLTADECRQVLSLVDGNPGLEKLLGAYSSKNASLSSNNALFGRQRSAAEKKAEKLQQDCATLATKIQQMEINKSTLIGRKDGLEGETRQLEKQINDLQALNQQLKANADKLGTDNRKLTTVNDGLKKDNKRLKELVDAIRLNFAQEVKSIMAMKNISEILRALAKLYKKLLG